MFAKAMSIVEMQNVLATGDETDLKASSDKVKGKRANPVNTTEKSVKDMTENEVRIKYRDMINKFMGLIEEVYLSAISHCQI